MKYYGLVMMSVTELIVTILAFLFLGRYLDHHLNNHSQYMTIGTIAGLVIGVIRMTIRLKGIMDSDSDA
jgi:hypothetical protein